MPFFKTASRKDARSTIAGHTEIVEYLIEKGADPYIQDKDGRTHLEIANQNNKTDAAQIIKDAMSKKISIILR